jgi:hypothetical protein
MELNPSGLNTIDELARTDPLWQKVLDQEAATSQVKLFFLMTRFNDVQVFVKHTLALYQANSENLVAHKMSTVPMLFDKHELWKNTEGGFWELTPEIIASLTKNIESATREKIEKHYPRWVLNQCFVTYCTILDSFLDSTLDAVFRHNPKILYGVSGAKNIELKRLIELGTVDEVIREIRTKEIRNFSSDDIGNRLDYLQRKLSIEANRLFDWGLSDEDTDRRLEGLNLDSLVKFYQQRHDIVHRDDTPISTYEELDMVSVFFLNIGSRLAMLIHEKHGIALDIFMLANRNVRYNALKAQAEIDP